MTAPASTLFSRRQTLELQKCLSVLDCSDSRDDKNCQRSGTSTAASTPPSSPTTPHPQQIRRFTRPSIDLNLVREGAFSSTSHRQTLPELCQGFEGLVKLDEGSCAVVYRAFSSRDQREVALKVSRTLDEEHVQFAKKEYNVLKLIHHPNIIKAFDFLTFTSGAVLVEEFFDGRSLQRMVDDAKYSRFSESTARHLFSQLVDAVAYLHTQGVIHRDVKASNLLISPDRQDLRLVDFNCCKVLVEGDALTMTGTREYMPPEVLKGRSPSEASDVWACGLCLHLMLIGCLPSKRGNSCVQLEGLKWEALTEPCKHILRKCLEPRRDVRPHANEILMYSWLQDLSKA